MLDVLAEAKHPFARSEYAPGHFTASTFVLSPDRGCLLLVLHSKLGRWLQPGGHVDAGDPTLRATAERELAEEVGVSGATRLGDGALDVDIHAIPPFRDEPAHEHLDVRFLLVAPSLEVHAASDARAARWVPLADVARVETDASVLRAVARIVDLLRTR